jgi:ADP-heptose:LPS heptosyltransferase
MSNRAVFIRSGGLGDFVLTLPVLSQALALYDETILFTRAGYHSLVRDYSNSLTLKDVDSDLEALGQVLPDSDVISFWQDEEWKRELQLGGCRNLYFPESRPTGGLHVSKAMFSTLGWDWLSGYSKKAWLGDHWSGENGLLWVHAGSGSTKKNAPLPYFTDLARKWLDAKKVNRVIFSFGEADDEVWSDFENLEISKDRRVQVVRSVDLGELKKMLADQASVFLGNDSGPGHLAASMGIPTRIVFRSTDRKIWAPLGPRVETYESISEASKIL